MEGVRRDELEEQILQHQDDDLTEFVYNRFPLHYSQTNFRGRCKVRIGK